MIDQRDDGYEHVPGQMDVDEVLEELGDDGDPLPVPGVDRPMSPGEAARWMIRKKGNDGG